MLNIHISIHGKGTPLVLFHGWGFDHQIWNQLLPELMPHYELFLVDLPGYGLTPFMDWEDFKAALISQLPSRFAIGGWSMGGLFATKLAIEIPQRVTHLLNIASSPCFIQKEDWPGGQPDLYKTFYENLTNEPQKTVRQFIELQAQGHAISVRDASLKGLHAGLDVLINWDLRKDLERLSLPVCYMFGRLDAIIPSAAFARMQSLYPRFKFLLFPRAAHALFLSHSEIFILALREFIK